MDTNAVSDIILAALTTVHARTYRNRAPQQPVEPYVVYLLDSATPTTPSSDYYLNVDVYDLPSAAVRAIEDIADSITTALDDRMLRTEALNLHLQLEQRQYISNTDLTTAQMINLRFVVRAYFL
jgi:hypothetical protein